MIKIAHEAPLSMFEQVQKRTDIDYCLANVYVDNEDYKQQFIKASLQGREIILDNGVFETGEAMSGEQYLAIINELEPEWFILPDVLENAQETVANAKAWNLTTKSKKIGVVQGKTLEELVWCYQEIEPLVDMVAISFDYSLYEKLGQADKFGQLQSWVYGRQTFLDYLAHGIVNRNKPHHLLGNALPQEGLYYSGNNPKFEWIYSIDTSNPVVHGLKGIVYKKYGLVDKERQKLFELINAEDPRSGHVEYNIQKFREFWNV